MTFKLAQIRITFYKNSLVIRNQIEYLIDKIESKLVYLGSSTIGLGRTFIPRTRRGLINGLGSIIKVITGNLDQEDAIKIDNQIQEIKRLAIHKQSQTLGIMTDFIKENNAKLNIISKNQKELNQAIKDLSKQNLGLENEMHVINIYNQIEICLQQVYDRVELLENAITFAHLGQLHPSIVDPSFLVAELMKIQGEASKNNTQFMYSPTIENIHAIEKSIELKAYSTNESINFVLEIPLVTNHPYSLLHLYSIPNKNNTILIPKNPYLILGSSEFAYPHEPCTSITEKVVICRHLEWHQLSKSEDCIAQLLQYRQPHNCKHATAEINNNIIKQIKENSWIAILKQEEIAKTTCGENVEYQRISGIVLITTNRKCNIKIAGRTLTTHMEYLNVKESIPLPKTQYASTQSPITVQLEEVNLDNLKDILKKTQVTQENDEPVITMKPSWPTICMYLIITIIASAVAIKWYLRSCKQSSAAPECLQLQSQELLQQQQQPSTCFTLKGGGVTSP
ncbi:uncharacterized protein LOC115449968 [Manduca sexta]|uniref:uncharacterized protein LOC115449968 n=1 Tax=Manduca sexta TaxID=7130 RepID=UPI00188FCAC9|nr:uncharacterized protein LOC115449968 [Manduca sexta]